jgi:predicted neutral ceramidase superfamily lipid hydrolase
MEQSKLIGYVRQASITALENLEPAVVSWRTDIIPKVKVIGEKQIEELTRVAERTAKRAKRLAISLFPASSLLLLFFFLF